VFIIYIYGGDTRHGHRVYLEMYFSSNVSKVELFKVTWDA
jgi:hypothetical protein